MCNIDVGDNAGAVRVVFEAAVSRSSGREGHGKGDLLDARAIRAMCALEWSALPAHRGWFEPHCMRPANSPDSRLHAYASDDPPNCECMR